MVALCRLVWNTTFLFGQSRCERMGGQVLELGNAQVGDGDEVGCGLVVPCSAWLAAASSSSLLRRRRIGYQ
jgi:hypothetical protein